MQAENKVASLSLGLGYEDGTTTITPTAAEFRVRNYRSLGALAFRDVRHDGSAQGRVEWMSAGWGPLAHLGRLFYRTSVRRDPMPYLSAHRTEGFSEQRGRWDSQCVEQLMSALNQNPYEPTDVHVDSSWSSRDRIAFVATALVAWGLWIGFAWVMYKLEDTNRIRMEQSSAKYVPDPILFASFRTMHAFIGLIFCFAAGYAFCRFIAPKARSFVQGEEIGRSLVFLFSMFASLVAIDFLQRMWIF